MSNQLPCSLETLLARVLGIPISEIHEGTGPDNLLDWNSLGHIRIVNSVEETFGITLTTKEIAQTRTVGQLRAVLHRRGVPA